MPRILPSAGEAVRAAEHAALGTARSHIDAGRELYDRGAWPQACFLAMTALEELGKALLLQLAGAEGQLPDVRELRDHGPKAIFGTVPALIFNDQARERHGTNPVTGLPRIEAVRYVAEGGEWMALRNACLYVDCDPGARTVAQPADEITREHAYLMIVAALEIFARIRAPGFTYRNIPVDADLDNVIERAVLEELATFQARERDKVDLDRLAIIGNPERVQTLRQAVHDAREGARQAALGTQAGERSTTPDGARQKVAADQAPASPSDTRRARLHTALTRLDRLARRLSNTYASWRFAREAAPHHRVENEETTPPPGEAIEMTSIFVAEAYPPSHLGALVDAIRRLGWDRPEMHEAILPYLDAWRSSLRGGSWLNLGPIIRPGGTRFLGSNREAPLPAAVDCAFARLYGITPSLSVLVVQFVLTEHAGSAIDRRLREHHRTTAKPVGGRRVRIFSPAHHKRDAVVNEMRTLIRSCQDWFRAEMPGAFADGLLRGDFPSTQFICSRREVLIETGRLSGASENHATVMGFRSDWEAWKAPDFPGLYLHEANEDMPWSLVLTGTTAGLHAGKSSGYADGRLALVQAVGDRVSISLLYGRRAAWWMVMSLVSGMYETQPDH